MSVRAYIVRSASSEVLEDGKIKRIQIEDSGCLFNVWHHTELFDVIRYNGWDCTNDDSVGEIGIYLEDWENIEKDDFKHLSKEELEIAKEIDEYFESGEEVLILNCY